MDRRKFARTALFGIGEIALLNSLAKPIAASGGPIRGVGKKPVGELSVRVGETVEITRSFRRCWFPTVHRFPSGVLMATMRMSPDECNPEGDFSAYCLSKDNGATWSRRYTMGAGANVDGAWSQDPRPDGSIWQVYDWSDPVSPGNTQDSYLTVTQFSQAGMKVEQRRNVPLHMSEPIRLRKTALSDRHMQDGHLSEISGAIPFGPILASRSGEMLATVYYKVERAPRYYRLACIRSTDNGRSWHEGAMIAAIEPDAAPWPGMGNEGPCEAGMARLTDGRLFVFFRTGSDGLMGASWSSDDGRRWTSPILLPCKGVAPRVRRLRSGILACSTGRPGPVVLMFSADGTGEAWSHTTAIFSDKSTHYTDFVEIAPGKLFLVYDSTPYGWGEIPPTDHESHNVIFGTFVDVDVR